MTTGSDFCLRFCALNKLAVAFVSTMFPHKEIQIQMAKITIRSITWPLDLIANDQCKMLERREVQIVQMNTIFDC